MSKKRLGEESSDEELDVVNLNQASAREEVQWTWKRDGRQTTRAKITLFSKRVIVEQIAEELKLIGDGVYQDFINSCFGFLMRLDTQGHCCSTALHCLLAHEVIKPEADLDELWYRVGGRFIRFSKYEYALVTGLSFGQTAFDPSADHHPPANGLFLRHYQGQNLTMDDLRSDFTDGVFRESPADALKVAKLLIVYFLLLGMETRTYIDEWAWTLIEDTDQWETFMWGKYTYQTLLSHLQGVPTQLSLSVIPQYKLYGYVWAFLIWAFEAIPELGIAYGVPTSDDVLPRCLRWRFFKKNQVYMDGFYDRQMEVHSTLEPSAEELRQPYWEHIDIPFKKKKMIVNPSSGDVLPVSRPQGSKSTPTRHSQSTSAYPMMFMKKRKRTGLLTTQEKAQKKMSDHECGYRDEMTRIVRGELPVLVRQELPSVIHLALKDFFSQRCGVAATDPLSPIGGASSSMRIARPRAQSRCLQTAVAVDQVGRNTLVTELNEKINELNNRNLENERLVGVFQKRYELFKTMVVKMGREIEDLRHEKLAAINTIEELRLKQLGVDKVVEEQKHKNLESNQTADELKLKKLESDKDVKLHKTMKIEDEDLFYMLTVDVGNPDTQNVKDYKDNSGNGSRSTGLSKKGDRNPAQPRTQGEDDDNAHNTVKTSRGSKSGCNPSKPERNDAVKYNENREPQGTGNIKTEFNGFNDEVSSDGSDESCTDSRMDDLITSLRSKTIVRKGPYEANMLQVLQQDDELCMNAVCALYRQHVAARKSKGHSSSGGFGPVDSMSGCALAEYLIDGDKELRLRKSVSEVKKEWPDAIGQCRKLAIELFDIYCTAEDPFFGQS